MGYQVRTGWGMPQHIRVSTGLLTEMQGFLDALESILVTGVQENHETPLSLSLNSIYPNPFNASCRIKISIPSEEPLDLTIYDISGRKIRSLVGGALEPGIHTLTWNGKDHAGRTMASGTYILNLVQGEYATSQRVSLLK